MDALYSWSLLCALLAGGASVVAGLVALVPSGRTGGGAQPGHLAAATPARARRAARWLAGMSVLAGLTSVFVHLRWGHGPDTPEPMAPLVFFSRHPAFLWSAALAVAGAVLATAVRAR